MIIAGERPLTVTFPDFGMGTYVVVGASLFLTYRILHQLIIYPYLLSPIRKIPGPPLGSDGFPSAIQSSQSAYRSWLARKLWSLLAGHFPAIIRSEAGVLQREWVKQYGPVVRAVGPMGIERLIFTSHEALHKILQESVDHPRPDFMRNVLGIVAGNGLLTVEGQEHKLMRRAMNPAFSLPNLAAQTDMYYEAIDGLLEIIGAQVDADRSEVKAPVIHIYEWMSKVTLDIICETAFGYRTDSLHNPHNELAEAYEELVNMQDGRMLARFIALVSIPGVARFLQSDLAYRWREVLGRFVQPQTRTLLESMHRIKRVSAGILEEKMKEAHSAPGDFETKKDIMSILVRARMAEEKASEGRKVGYAMSDGEMMDQVLTFLGAGHETTASGLAWTLWLLAKDPESQRRLRDELKPVYDANPHPDYRTLKDLKFLECVVMESLRLMPPVPMTFRKAAKTEYIDGVLVPKGTIFYVPIRVVNTMRSFWGPDAEDFRPTRWLDPPRSAHFQSFIAGPHACIGKTMAIIEMKAILAALIAQFEFEPAYEGQVPQPTAAVTMKPKDGMPLCVKRA
ncbi:cytochrome P450 [Schizophyllum commune]